MLITGNQSNVFSSLYVKSNAYIQFFSSHGSIVCKIYTFVSTNAYNKQPSIILYAILLSDLHGMLVFRLFASIKFTTC